MEDILREPVELNECELGAVAGGWGFTYNGGNVVVSILNGNNNGNVNGNGNGNGLLTVVSGNGNANGNGDGNTNVG
jgi:hypothetical protein